MNNTQFYTSFHFNAYHFSSHRYTNLLRGIKSNYIVRLNRGAAKIVCNKCADYLEPGDIFFIPKGLSYQSYWYVDDTGIVEYDSVGFDVFPDTSHKKYSLQKLNFGENETKLFNTITSTLNVDCYNIGCLYSLLASFVDDLKYETISKHDHIITKAQEFMQNTEKYTIKDVAKYCNISVSGLYSVFQKKCGHTPIEEKQIILVNKAIDLLQTTDSPISEIIGNVGFSSEPYFRKIFFRITGKTPRQVRSQSIHI